MAGNLKALLGAGITIAVLVIILTVSSLIVGDLRTEAEATGSNVTHAYNITTEGGNAIFELADWLPLIALVVSAAVIVGIVVYYMGGVSQ